MPIEPIKDLKSGKGQESRFAKYIVKHAQVF